MDQILKKNLIIEIYVYEKIVDTKKFKSVNSLYYNKV